MKYNPKLNKFDLVIALAFTIVTFILIDNLRTREEERKNDIETALSECVADLENQCGATINYAISLEKENARLRRVLKQCHKKDAK